MTQYIYFCDLNVTLHNRYSREIVHSLLLEISCLEPIFLVYEECDETLFANYNVFNVSGYSNSQLSFLLSEKNPSLLMTFAQRINDIRIVALARQMGFEAVTMQHGIWSDRIERLSLLRTFILMHDKVMTNFKVSRELAKILRVPFIFLLFDVFTFFYRDKGTIKRTITLNNSLIKTHFVYSFDSSWDSYYMNKWSYEKKNFIYIGNPDFRILKKQLIIDKSGICYIAQSLVEDGRYSSSAYEAFLRILLKILPDERNLYVKLHPRSNKEIYSILSNKHNVILTSDFPLVSHYIGHYSSLLAIPSFLQKNICIWLLENHYTPNNFMKYGDVITNEVDELTNFLKGRKDDSAVSIDFIKDPVEIVSEHIKTLLNDGRKE